MTGKSKHKFGIDFRLIKLNSMFTKNAVNFEKKISKNVLFKRNEIIWCKLAKKSTFRISSSSSVAFPNIVCSLDDIKHFIFHRLTKN